MARRSEPTNMQVTRGPDAASAAGTSGGSAPDPLPSRTLGARVGRRPAAPGGRAAAPGPS